MDIERQGQKVLCRQRLDGDDFEGVVRVVRDDLLKAGRDPATVSPEEAEELFREVAEQAGVATHGMGGVTCCGGCTHRFRAVWQGLLEQEAA